MSELDRRTFLTRSAVLLGAGGVGGAGAIVRAATKTERPRRPPPSPQRHRNGTSPRHSSPSGALRRAPSGRHPHARTGASDVRGTRFARARPQDARRSPQSAEPARARTDRRQPHPAARGRRSTRRLGNPRAAQRPRRADRHDRLRSLAVRRTLRPRLAAPTRADQDADVLGRRPRPGSEPRRPAAADLRPSARHRRAHAARAAAHRARHHSSCAGTSTASPAPPAAPRRTTALATCSPSATEPPTPRPATRR